jgi:small ligand-binding sensory domain FIST
MQRRVHQLTGYTEPHAQANALVDRLQGVLPETPIIGGVVSDCGWGASRSTRGALFHGEATLNSGAVGCLLLGPVQVRLLPKVN